MRDDTRGDTQDDSNLDGPKENDRPAKPAKEEDGQAGDDFDRAQPELTEQNLLVESYTKEPDPERREALEGDLEELSGDIQDANRK